MNLTLKDLDDLEQSSRFVTWLRRPSVDRVLVALPQLDEPERQRAATELEHLFNDCGCLWGSLGFLAAFVSVFTVGLLQGGFSWAILGASLGIGISAALVGKLLGLRWSYWRLRAWYRRMLLSQSDTRGTGIT